jgi:cell division protein FtsW
MRKGKRKTEHSTGDSMTDGQDRAASTIHCLPMRDNAAGQGLIVVALAMIGLGVVTVHSALATVGQTGPWYARVDVRQGVFAVVAAVVLLLGWRFDYRLLLLRGRVPWLAGFGLLLALVLACLVFVPGVGHGVGGKFRWIRIGPRNYSIGLQPSELVKIALAVFLSAWLTRPGRNVRSLATFAVAGLVTLLCVGLTLTQDFGTAVLIGLLAGAAFFLAGVPWYFLAPLPVLAGGVFFHIVISTPFRLQRIEALLDPWATENPSTYQIRQSLLAVLSGGWTGAGLGNGVRKLGFLPEDSTDFLFASFCEEWGFVGAALLGGLMVVFLLLCRRIARRAADPFGRVLAATLGVMVVLQGLMHLAVNLVLLPPTGIAMPLMSAGGTGLVVMAGAVAMIVSVSARTSQNLCEPRPTVVRSSAADRANLPAPSAMG